MDHPDLTVSNFMETSIGPKRVYNLVKKHILLKMRTDKNQKRHNQFYSREKMKRETNLVILFRKVIQLSARTEYSRLTPHE